MKRLLPINYQFSCCPMRFNIIEPERVRSMVIENEFEFYMVIVFKLIK